MDFVPAIRDAIRGVDKNQPVAEIGTLEESVLRSTAMFATFVIGSVQLRAGDAGDRGSGGLRTACVNCCASNAGVRGPADTRRAATTSVLAAVAASDGACGCRRHPRVAPTTRRRAVAVLVRARRAMKIDLATLCGRSDGQDWSASTARSTADRLAVVAGQFPDRRHPGCTLSVGGQSTKLKLWVAQRLF